jgi:hypothetical protein
MKLNLTSFHPRTGSWAGRPLVFLLAAALWPVLAHASEGEGETLDAVADFLTWVVLILAPVIGIVVFLGVHVLPEKIAEKRKHPQTTAIQTLCLLSLVFGGLLWPIAWLWAFTKPVLYKAAYGTDVDESHGHAGKPKTADDAEQLERLKAEVSALEAKLAAQPNTQGGKA